VKNKWLFVLLLSLTAFVIAGTAAYFSVFGLSKLFAGAGISALVLFGSLEFGKLVSVSVLYRFWKHLSWMIRIPFTTMIIGIMLITSMGIYGFLRNAYDQTSNKYTTIQKEATIQNQRKGTIQLEIDRYQNEIDSKNKQINTYLENRATQEQLVSSLYTQSADTNMDANQSWVFRTRAKQTQDGIKEYDELISDLRNQNDAIYTKINSLNDSISTIDRNVLELESSDISVEIGPLKYLSDASGWEMDDVVGALIFLIIFVFDPFAILLIIVANRLSMLEIDEPKPKIIKEKKKWRLFKKKKPVEPVISDKSVEPTKSRRSGVIDRWKKKIEKKKDDKTDDEYIDNYIESMEKRFGKSKSVEPVEPVVVNEPVEPISDEPVEPVEPVVSVEPVEPKRKNGIVDRWKKKFIKKQPIVEEEPIKPVEQKPVDQGRYSHRRGAIRFPGT